MVKLVCPADSPRAEGLECAKTCQNYDLECVSVGCVSGCLCPPGMVSHPSRRGMEACRVQRAGGSEVGCGGRERKKELHKDGTGAADGVQAGAGGVLCG